MQDFTLDMKQSEAIDSGDDIQTAFHRGKTSRSNKIYFNDAVVPDEKKSQTPPVFKNVTMVFHRIDENSVNAQIAVLSPEALRLDDTDALEYQLSYPGPYCDQKYPEAYKAYIQAKKFAQSGVALDSLPYLRSKPEVIATLKESGIHSLEQLSAMPLKLKSLIPDCDGLIKKAAQYLQISSDESLIKGLENDNKQKENKIADLEAVIASLKSEAIINDNNSDNLDDNEANEASDAYAPQSDLDALIRQEATKNKPPVSKSGPSGKKVA